MRKYQEEIKYVKSVITRGATTSRRFDSHFEMCEEQSDFIASHLLTCCIRNPNGKLALNFKKYLGVSACVNSFHNVFGYNPDLPRILC